MFRVMVHTRDALNRIALEFLFESCKDIALSVIPDAAGVLASDASNPPDVLLLSADSGVDTDLLASIRSKMPATKVILWLHEISAETAYQVLGSGIRGVLRRDLPPETIIACVRKVQEGELWLDTALTQMFFSARPVAFSKREDELITLVSRGLKNREIASVMSITEGTVKVYVSRLFEKLGVRDRVELALFGLRNAHRVTPAPKPAATLRKPKAVTLEPARFLLARGPR